MIRASRNRDLIESLACNHVIRFIIYPMHMSDGEDCLMDVMFSMVVYHFRVSYDVAIFNRMPRHSTLYFD